MSKAIASSQAQAETRRIWLKRFMTIGELLTPQKCSLQIVMSDYQIHSPNITVQV